jgi:hypothetical protein
MRSSRSLSRNSLSLGENGLRPVNILHKGQHSKSIGIPLPGFNDPNPSFVSHFNEGNERIFNISINDKLDEIIRQQKISSVNDQETKAKIVEIKTLLENVLKQLNQPGYLNSISSYAQYPYNAVFGSNTKKKFNGGSKTRRKKR